MSVKEFLFRERRIETKTTLSAISLFSGGGLSDLGYELAGFETVVQVEKDKNRVALCAENFSDTEVICSEVQNASQEIVQKYREVYPDDRPALLSVTPPCQGMSNSNPGRGARGRGQRRDARNRLLLESVPVIKALKPRVVVIENVPALLTEPHSTTDAGEELSVVDAFAVELPDYFLFGRVVQMADYGVAQDRRRAIVVAVHVDESWAKRLLQNGVGPWPAPTHAKEPSNGLLRWVTVEEWFNEMNYRALDAKSEKTARDPKDPLHFVPHYEGDYYLRVADIPSRSGRSAYQNSGCHGCGHTDIPESTATCPYCSEIMRNRPYVVEEDGTVRLIKGRRHSSYRRMRPDEPARTITTASSHVGSDYKIHPWENRVLSVRECADLQTVPRFYDWTWALETSHTYVARKVIGEALPPWFTYLQGKLLRRLLDGEKVSIEIFTPFRLALNSVPRREEDREDIN